MFKTMKTLNRAFKYNLSEKLVFQDIRRLKHLLQIINKKETFIDQNLRLNGELKRNQPKRFTLLHALQKTV